jgi:ankyrin repeat protein
MANSVPCMPRGRPTWCSCFWNLDYNADHDLEDDIYHVPLHWYATRHDIAAMRAILQRGAEVNPDTGLEKPLHEAAESILDAVKLLVESGADVEVTDGDSKTPLHLAATTGKTEVVRFLVEQWPEGMRSKDCRLNTPLHCAEREEDRCGETIPGTMA